MEFPGGEESRKMLIKQAYIALYEAKRRGNNPDDFYAKRLEDNAMQRSRMEALLR